MVKQSTFAPNKLVHGRKLAARAGGGLESEKNSERRSFLSLEEAGLVEMSGISIHERKQRGQPFKNLTSVLARIRQG
ncbi:hypothetical protein NC652_027424 [Populus alba x Populus x berolinensis]|nr:hypothetical protein NC652_027424 [Populus alba x Populus x berolinensis]